MGSPTAKTRENRQVLCSMCDMDREILIKELWYFDVFRLRPFSMPNELPDGLLPNGEIFSPIDRGHRCVHTEVPKPEPLRSRGRLAMTRRAKRFIDLFN